MSSTEFPPIRRGQALHAFLVFFLAALTAVFVWLATRQPIGLLFTVFVALATFAFLPIFVIAYRWYALTHSNYSLDRDKLTLTWGLRSEQIPISNIEWVRPPAALAGPLPLPVFRLPGSLLGMRHHRDLGPLEFLASDASALLLVATQKQVFVISPEDASGFLQTLQRAMEMGSLSPAAAQSVYPTFVIAQAWSSALARFLWLAGLFLNIGLLAWVSLIGPTLRSVSLGFLPNGEPRPANPGISLVLLPVVSLFFYLVGWVTGLAIYRREDRRAMAQLVWAGGVASALLFLVAVLFIVTIPV